MSRAKFHLPAGTAGGDGDGNSGDDYGGNSGSRRNAAPEPAPQAAARTAPTRMRAGNRRGRSASRARKGIACEWTSAAFFETPTVPEPPHAEAETLSAQSQSVNRQGPAAPLPAAGQGRGQPAQQRGPQQQGLQQQRTRQPSSPPDFLPGRTHSLLRQINPTALGITVALHLLLFLPLAGTLLKEEDALAPLEKNIPQVELVPPPFVQTNPFANQEHISTDQEGAQNQRAAQEADPDLQSHEQGPQLEGDDPQFNRIVSGAPDAPDAAPVPTPLWEFADLPEGSAPAQRRPQTAAGSAPLVMQTRRDTAPVEVATVTQAAATAQATQPTQPTVIAQPLPAAQATPAAQAPQAAQATLPESQAEVRTSPAPVEAAAPQTPQTAPANLPRVLEAPVPAEGEGLPAADSAQADSPPLPQGEEQMPALPVTTPPPVQPASGATATVAQPLPVPEPQPATDEAATQHAEAVPAPAAVTNTPTSVTNAPAPVTDTETTSTALPVAAEAGAAATDGAAAETAQTQSGAEGAVAEPGAPRPRPVLQPRISAGPLRHQAAVASRRGVVAIDSKFSEFGAYQQRMVEAISAQWYLLARQSRAIDSEYGTQVVLRFKMNDQGIVSDTEVRFTNASAAATLLCINAVESRSPFGLWNSQMQRVLGKEQTITFTFYYR